MKKKKFDSLNGLFARKGTLQDQIDHLVGSNVDLRNQIATLMQDVHKATAPDRLLEITAQGFAKENARLTKLRDETRQLMEFGITRGLWTREELNEALII